MRIRIIHITLRTFLMLFMMGERLLLNTFHTFVKKRTELAAHIPLIATAVLVFFSVITVKLLSMGGMLSDETPGVSEFYRHVTRGVTIADLYANGGLAYEAPPLSFSTYTVASNDNLWNIAKNTGLRMDTVMSVNKLTSAYRLYTGMTLKVPNRNGILYTATEGDTLDSICMKNAVDKDEVRRANHLNNELAVGDILFLPGGRFSALERIDRLGLLFRSPLVQYRITAVFGMRRDPFTKLPAFHKGIDLAVWYGAPVLSAKEGSIIYVGEKPGYGNVVIIQHPGGYISYYGHLSGFATAAGRQVVPGSIIGYAGSTGYSTGPHVHFEIRKDGRAIDPLSLTSFK
ncbi:MAG: M23 family metallopeptidase [Spirochaetes bacterium]|nr:M23 family metallopeptidase [Spirochaetota bacterium]